MFSYGSALKELQRLNKSGGEGLYKLEKRWYGWVIVDTDWSEFNPMKRTDIAKLCSNAQALLDMDAQGILRPTGVCGAAREIIEKFIAYHAPKQTVSLPHETSKPNDPEKV